MRSISVGIPFDQFERQFDLSEPIDKEQLLSEVKVSGLDIVELKGYTSSGIALSVCRLIGAIMRNEHAVVPASVVLNGEYGAARCSHEPAMRHFQKRH